VVGWHQAEALFQCDAFIHEARFVVKRLDVVERARVDLVYRDVNMEMGGILMDCRNPLVVAKSDNITERILNRMQNG